MHFQAASEPNPSASVRAPISGCPASSTRLRWCSLNQAKQMADGSGKLLCTPTTRLSLQTNRRLVQDLVQNRLRQRFDLTLVYITQMPELAQRLLDFRTTNDLRVRTHVRND